MIDETGNLYIADAILALSIIFIVMLMVNTLISLPNPIYSEISHNSKDSQDIMEILSGKIDFDDKPFLAKITEILKDGEDSEKSVKEVSLICKDKFKEYNLTNYRFVENNHLDSKVLASSGNLKENSNVSSATRCYDDYSYTLMVW